ncbi:MAG TPA: discoidin domain-containing protein, partial [Pirellulales bacterium]
LVCEVRANSIKLLCNGATVVDWHGDPTRLPLGVAKFAGYAGLLVGGWRGNYCISQIDLTPVGSAVADSQSAVGLSASGDPSGPEALAADRRAAEYVLSVGGKIKINGQLDGLSKWQGDVREITSASDLPDGPFDLTFIDLNVSRGVTEAGMKALQGTKHLQEIVIDGCTGITDASLANLKDNRQLKSLHLYRTKISAAGLRHFKECSELNWLYLGMWSAFGDEDMEFFKEFSGLSSLGMLWLHGTSVGDAGLAYLKGANKLCQLNLNGTKITDNGLRALEKHPKIMYLHLHDNSAIGDAGLVWLRECHGLRHLNLNNTKVTADGARSLKRALPDCKILWGGGEVALNEANADSGSSNSDSGVKPAAAAAPSQASSPADSTALPRARYVRIELPRTGTLSLAEVEAYSGGRNLARSGKATQKSTGYGGHASRVIDGNTSGSYDDGGASHTGNDISEPWWEVDLGDVYPLENIVVYNRTDGDFEKWLSGFTLLVLDADRRVVAKRMGIPAPMPSARFDVKDLLTGVEPAPAAKLTAKEASTLKQHTGAVTRVAFHRTMPALASAGKDGRVLVWNLKNPRAQALEAHKFNEEVWAVKFSPEGAVLALANRNYWGSRLFFKTLTGQKLNEIKDFKGAQSAVASIAYSPDGRLFAAGLDNGTIRLWDGAQFRELSPVGLGTGHAVHSLAFGPITSDRKSRSVEYLLAEGGQDGAARTLTAKFAAGQWTFGPTPVEFPKGAAITGVRFSRDGKLLGFTRVGGHVCLCDARTGQALRDLSGGSRNGDAAESIAFHPEKPWCVTGHKSAQAARIWHIETAEMLAELKGHTGGVMCAEFSPDGRQVATASEDFSIKVWDLSGGDLPEVAKKGKKAKPAAPIVGD